MVDKENDVSTMAKDHKKERTFIENVKREFKYLTIPPANVVVRTTGFVLLSSLCWGIVLGSINAGLSMLMSIIFF